MLCAIIERNASDGTILCHNQRYIKKWHRALALYRYGRLFVKAKTGSARRTTCFDYSVSI